MADAPDISHETAYLLDAQVGFILRRASQRHLSIFSDQIDGLTPTQFAVLAKLSEAGALSQNALGRMTAMDAATIKGVVDRLVARKLLRTQRDLQDRRRMIIDLSASGRALYMANKTKAAEITARTLSPLSKAEQVVFLDLLARLC